MKISLLTVVNFGCVLVSCVSLDIFCITKSGLLIIRQFGLTKVLYLCAGESMFSDEENVCCVCVCVSSRPCKNEICKDVGSHQLPQLMKEQKFRYCNTSCNFS